MKPVKCLLLISLLTTCAVADELTIKVNPHSNSDETFIAKKNVEAILGDQAIFGIRKDLEEKVKEHAMGYKERTRQILVHMRAHDLFMTAESPEQAYNAYLLMTAAQKCLASKEGVGESGASNILFDIAQHQIDTEVRRQAVVKSEYMLKRGDFPSLNINSENSYFCQYTNQPIIVNKELQKFISGEQDHKDEEETSG